MPYPTLAQALGAYPLVDPALANKPRLRASAAQTVPARMQPMPEPEGTSVLGTADKLGLTLMQPGVWGMLAGLGAALAPAGSWQSQLGQMVAGMAQANLYNRYLRSLLAGLLGAERPFVEGGLGQFGIEMIPPEAQLAGVETATRLLSALPQPQQPKAKRYQTVELEIDSEGKQTPGKLHRWVWDPETGDLIKYMGPADTEESEAGVGSQLANERAVFRIAMNMAASAVPGMTTITLPDGRMQYVFANPSRDKKIFHRWLYYYVRRFQRAGLLSPAWLRSLPKPDEPEFEQMLAGLTEELAEPEKKKKKGGLFGISLSDLLGIKKEKEKPEQAEYPQTMRTPDGKVAKFQGLDSQGRPIYVDETGKRWTLQKR